MGQIKIQDSGYIKSTNEGIQASASSRANSGTVISLKSAEFIPSIKRNISEQSSLATNIPNEVNLGSIENMKFKLRCVLDTLDSTDMSYTKHLLDMIRTDGYKFMWYDYTDSSDENNNGQLIYQIALNSIFGNQFTNGEKTAFSVSDNFYHLHVIFTNILPRHVSKSNIIIYDIDGIILPSEDSSI